MEGGAVASRIERIDVTVVNSSGDERTVRLVRKWTWEHEVLGLRAAQAVIATAPAIPILVAEGQDEHGPWLMTPFYVGQRVSSSAIPPTVFESLALLHARYANDSDALARIPVVNADWWRDICLSYALPEIDRQAAIRPDPVLDRARDVLQSVAGDARAGTALGRLSGTLLHGDVHTGNILVAADRVTLVDWGSARVGPAMLDLANVARADSPQFAAYAQAWERVSGTALDAPTIELGYRWAALQIPIQYLAWAASTGSAERIRATLDQAEAALAAL
jgi:aminoglycoside phosphotransferase (APT) family kinase protein